MYRIKNIETKLRTFVPKLFDIIWGREYLQEYNNNNKMMPKK